MKKKIILSIAFLISLLPMLFNQYGGLKGVQEITGLINLLNPIGIVSVILFVLGVWFPVKKRVVSKSLGALGVIGIVVSEIYKFLTWHTLTVTGEVSLQNSIRLAFPEFYIGLTISLVKVSLLMNHTSRPGDVADPWYTGDFEATWQDVLEGCTALLEELR